MKVLKSNQPIGIKIMHNGIKSLELLPMNLLLRLFSFLEVTSATAMNITTIGWQLIIAAWAIVIAKKLPIK